MAESDNWTDVKVDQNVTKPAGCVAPYSKIPVTVSYLAAGHHQKDATMAA